MFKFLTVAIALLLLSAAPAAAQHAGGGMLPDGSNATLPDARNNLIYTPPSCDGFSAQDGAITSSTADFASASASFTLADVGKKISINGAGPTQYFGTATIAGGGAGHFVGEEIPLTGGTGTAGTVVVRAETAGVITAVAGKPGDLGSYTAVPSNPVTAGDATLTVTWLRDNLVTTIASRDSSTQVTLTDAASATVSGVLWGYGTDYAGIINIAVAAGNNAWIPPVGSKCGVGSTVSMDSFEVLFGSGSGGYGAATTTLMWLGPVGGTVLQADTGTLINGIRIGPFNIDGLGAASYGARFRGLAHSNVQLTSQNVKDFAISLEESADGLYDTFFNDFRLVAVVNGTASTNANGIDFPDAVVSSGAHDVNGNNFYNTSVFHRDGIGINLKDGYLNNFYLTQLYSFGNGWAILFGGSNIDARLTSRRNSFFTLIAQQPVYSQGGTHPANGSMIFPFDDRAFAARRTIETGSTLFCTSSSGNPNLCTTHAYFQAFGGNPTGTTTTANYVAMGVGGTFTPNYSGKMQIVIDGGLLNNNATSGVLSTLYYGTGTPPVNGDNIEIAGTTRNQCGGFPPLVNTPSTTFVAGMSASCQAALTPGTTYWFDIGIKAVTAGTASLKNAYARATELP